MFRPLLEKLVQDCGIVSRVRCSISGWCREEEEGKGHTLACMVDAHCNK